MKHERVVLDGHRLTELRVGNALTQGDLAEKAGITTRTIYRAEHGEPMRLSTLRRLASALEVRPRELVAA